MCPSLNAGRMGRFDQGNAAFGKLPGQSRTKELKFTAAGPLDEDFDQLPDRPALTRQGLVETCKAGGNSGPRWPGKLVRPPEGRVDLFRVSKQKGRKAHVWGKTDIDTV